MEDPAMTDFRARGTIIGPAGLTAVFGMGTGGTPRVSSPESGDGAVRLHHHELRIDPGCGVTQGTVRIRAKPASGINHGRRFNLITIGTDPGGCGWIAWE